MVNCYDWQYWGCFGWIYDVGGVLGGFSNVGVFWLEFMSVCMCDTLNLVGAFTNNHTILYNKHV